MFFALSNNVGTLDVLCGIGVVGSSAYSGIPLRLTERSTGITRDAVFHPEGWFRLQNGHGFLGVGEGIFADKYIFIIGCGAQGFSREVAVFDRVSNQPYEWLKIRLAEILAKISEEVPV